MSTDQPPAADSSTTQSDQPAETTQARSNSFSQQSRASNDSQTAAEFLRDQELLEADAREALPYSIDSCTKILGSLRQNVFACLTCNPAPSTSTESWKPAGVCYACSIQCHGEHNLVEIFQKRNFTCDCGTKRIPSTTPCALRTNEETNTKGGVHSEEPDANNKYNHNFRNRFCGCECDYDPFQQKGTMFQCLGLGTAETGGCGEDWYHPGCLVGMGPQWFEKMQSDKPNKANGDTNDNGLATIAEGDEEQRGTGQTSTEHAVVDEDDEPPLPPGFPDEDAFEGFLCYKCVESNPWIKAFAGTAGFLPAVFLEQSQTENTEVKPNDPNSKKRKADDDSADLAEAKRVKGENEASTNTTTAEPTANTTTSDQQVTEVSSKCKLSNLGTPSTHKFSLFFKENFRDQFCRCSACFPKLNMFPQLLEEEEVYEPPISEDGASQHGGSTNGSGSLLERGESALRNVDRVRAIEGVMAYNHLKEQLKPFFKQFADSGQAVGAEDIKAYFAKLRGDEQGIKEAGEAAASSKDGGGDGGGGGSGEGGHRSEQSGY